MNVLFQKIRKKIREDENGYRILGDCPRCGGQSVVESYPGKTGPDRVKCIACGAHTKYESWTLTAIWDWEKNQNIISEG